jgi:spore coat protein U-like protein
MKTLLSRAALAAAAMALGLSDGQATQAPGNLSVSLTVTSNCTVGTSSSITFPKTTGQQDVDGQGSVSITCASGTTYTVALGTTLHYTTSRQMQTSDASGVIPYELYSDPARTIVWNSSSPLPKTSTGTDLIPVYGHALASGATPGTYNDTVSITVYY